MTYNHDIILWVYLLQSKTTRTNQSFLVLYFFYTEIDNAVWKYLLFVDQK